MSNSLMTVLSLMNSSSGSMGCGFGFRLVIGATPLGTHTGSPPINATFRRAPRTMSARFCTSTAPLSCRALALEPLLERWARRVSVGVREHIERRFTLGLLEATEPELGTVVHEIDRTEQPLALVRLWQPHVRQCVSCAETLPVGQQRVRVFQLRDDGPAVLQLVGLHDRPRLRIVTTLPTSPLTIR